MPEPFKNNFSLELVNVLVALLNREIDNFPEKRFVDLISDEFEALELKARSNRIAEALHQFMPQDLNLCSSVIKNILHPDDVNEFVDIPMSDAGLRGWMVMPVADFVSRRYLPSDFKEGMELLKLLTRRFSAEFAIRDFFLADTERAMVEILRWTKDPNHNVRRLASEGSRPRLPWGQQLPMFIKEPSRLRPILENLVDDESEYVRRSVANNLNDIAKDHPDFVIDFVSTHLNQSNQNQYRLFKHACRSLFKQGDKRILALFGYTHFNGAVRFVDNTNSVEWGGKLEFEIEISSHEQPSQNLMLDFVLWLQRANGTLSPKVFKWKVIEDFTGSKRFKKSHSFKPVTTRKYYPGEHKIEIQINGAVVCERTFILLENKTIE